MMNDKLSQDHLLDEIRQIHKELIMVISFINELKQDYVVLENQIELTSNDVMTLLGVSKSTLSRWRNNNLIPFRYIALNQVVYPFKELYIAVKIGRASCRGFSRVEVLQRLNAYKDGVIKGYKGNKFSISNTEE